MEKSGVVIPIRQFSRRRSSWSCRGRERTGHVDRISQHASDPGRLYHTHTARQHAHACYLVPHKHDWKKLRVFKKFFVGFGFFLRFKVF